MIIIINALKEGTIKNIDRDTLDEITKNYYDVAQSALEIFDKELLKECVDNNLYIEVIRVMLQTGKNIIEN